ncbi:MAG: L-glutamate gamma-semialdehyde dehydrogenase [Ignavibacteriales bacterium]|nr:MAG: L-glutamate gamma-semialdehyde dehydrogenase [Ignavibacteriaceae bacterium]MBW7871848.1 L-glutamate gamma-semialdehyde dehydrogenase [Ignavibacteria bacterium]MCZ2144302.1 L-glutamate gamma-semialdehyde dehydrogenase [Ignavibacteriales bacterium]MBV6446255.1 1-pyrroline-5-carboxylate dehydrogenase 2 [Ignavibacteriaceae bacterium]MBZ0197307.1 L-glutamate gamma-semialdehyde dehydrogenase [Ignavibacteriaceae bacterium]
MNISPFINEAYLDFSKPENFNAQKAAIDEARKKFGASYPLIIGGKEVVTERTFNSYNPSNKEELLAVFSKGDVDLANKAVDEALKAFETWRYTTPQERAELLFRAAAIMRRRKLEINAWMVLEAGKNYGEADADTAEAIDFLEFYGREMLRYGDKQPISPLPGEENELVYIPLGVGVIVPPWNFPFAILAGMSSAAIVTGNTIVLKPSSETPMMGRLYYEVMKEAGVPDGVLNFLPGSGAEVGDTLVAHPKVRFISFTGSMEVGTHIYELAAKVQPGQIWLKRVVAEMGGKDSIIVDSDTNLDDAADGIVAAAFGFQGQKCSACSRAIIDEKVYDTMLDKIKERVEKIRVGPAEDNFRMGPVISASAERGILKYIEIGKNEGRVITGGQKAEGDGYYISPTVIADVDPMARISQEEIFGPVLAVIKSPNFDESLKICNNTIYGLTGAVYSNNRDHLNKAKKELLIGNLYFNRKCTGAMVGGHPFGGFNMSGTDSKAGGRDYLLLFLQAKTMSEKIK